MKTDIVERLGVKDVDDWKRQGLEEWDMLCIRIDASNEITRLRAQLAEAQRARANQTPPDGGGEEG